MTHHPLIRLIPDIHNKKNTIKIYTHVSKLNFDKFINPLDDLFFNAG